MSTALAKQLATRSRPHKLLGRRIVLYYGSAVLITIVVSLGFPWIQMRLLTEQAARIRAEGAATLARQFFDLDNADFAAANDRLKTRWPDFSGLFSFEGGFPKSAPLFVKLADVVGSKGFRTDSKNYFLEKEQESFFSRIEEGGRLLRLAMAIRDDDASGSGSLIGLVDVSVPVSQSTQQLNTWVTLLGGGLGAMLAIVVFYLLTERLVLNPLGKLRQTAEQVASGNAAARARIKTGDEFELLAGAFNEMLEHLIRSQEELSRINRSLDIRIEELARINFALNEVSRLKSDFLANVSHELRTPLVSIIGFAELLQEALEPPAPAFESLSVDGADKKEVAETSERRGSDEPQLPATAQEEKGGRRPLPGETASARTQTARMQRFASNILTSGRMLLDLINDLLDLAKIEAGKLDPHYSTLSLESTCRDAIDLVRPLADKKGVSISVDIEPVDLVRSDAGKIKQILYNLLSNAIKFSPSKETAGLRVWSLEVEGKPMFGMCVWDRGPGIPKDQQSAIFERFRQLDSSRTRQYQGTGLGLTITRQLVQMLGGRISVESEEGQGASFTVLLPQSPGEGLRAKEPTADVQEPLGGP